MILEVEWEFLILDDEDKKEKLKTDDTAESDQEIEDETKGKEEENLEDSDNDLIDEEVADEPQGDKEEEKEDHKSESD